MLDLDIAFCWGQLKTEDKTVVCPIRNTCKRFWNEERMEYAKKTGDMFHTFLLMDKPEDIHGCPNFIPKDEPNIQEDQLVHGALEELIPEEVLSKPMTLYLNTKVKGDNKITKITEFIQQKMNEETECDDNEEWHKGNKHAYGVVLNFILNEL